MKAINLKGVFSSGLITGIIINISAITMVPAIGNEMDKVLADKGLPPLSNADMVFFSFVSFIFGIFLMFLYALLRPHLGSRLKTAILVSVLVWFITYFLSNVSLIVYGFMPTKLVVIGTVWGLGELLLASIVGCRLYKEIKTE